MASEFVFQERRGASQQEEPAPPPAAPTNQDVAMSLFYDPPPLVDVPAQYDRSWLQLVQHYFSLRVWGPATDPGQPVSLLELLFDLLCTFQIPMPHDLIKHKEVPFPGVEVPRKRKCFYVFPVSQGRFLPPVTFKESLSPSYANRTHSYRIRPSLLSPDAASTALRLHILPHQRNLAVSLSVPVVVPRPLPDFLLDRFW